MKLTPNMVFLLFCAVTILGCSPKETSVPTVNFPAEIWKNIPPYEEQGESSIEDVEKRLVEPAVRAEVLSLIKNYLSQKQISHKDQVKMGILTVALQKTANAQEASNIRELISIGSKHPDYYALSLSVLPNFLPESIKVFNAKTMLAKFPDPASGNLREYDIQESFLRKLKRASGKEIGKNYHAWLAWWQKAGSKQVFDKETGQYTAPDRHQ